jgi:hypothetical protein
MSFAACLTAIAVLENPRQIPKSNIIVFDSQVYLGSSDPALIGSLRLFNNDNAEFADVGCYIVVIHVCDTPPSDYGLIDILF